ncbi:MAG: DUF433 domain-containing protein [Firmicutes bacterium]|nr:DUF433 domain-containing protein [Bacillota bacterium]MBU4533422.1 DUF433 domain-containing protein [Bacillota bacterium]MBU4554564.1 DUF433 domain-containing protein [Bacillota bacterium]MDQ7789784.1 DUF433 domain-containing protein [Clostridia bacterium]
MKEISPGIVIDPDIKGGKPVIKGTRVPVDLFLGWLAGGSRVGKYRTPNSSNNPLMSASPLDSISSASISLRIAKSL